MIKEFVGKIDVEGLVCLGDPYYNQDVDLEWMIDHVEKYSDKGVTEFSHDSGYSGQAVGVSCAEGTYPVYVIRNNDGSIKRIIIDLDEEKSDA